MNYSNLVREIKQYSLLISSYGAQKENIFTYILFCIHGFNIQYIHTYTVWDLNLKHYVIKDAIKDDM